MLHKVSYYMCGIHFHAHFSSQEHGNTDKGLRGPVILEIREGASEEIGVLASMTQAQMDTEWEL